MEAFEGLVFVVIDGLIASGKSTQAFRLCSFLRSRRKTVYLRFHPSKDNSLGVKAKQFLYSKGKGAHFAAAFFYMVDVIRSILLYSWQRYDYVVFVRYLMGTAYLPSPLYRIAYHFFARARGKTSAKASLNIDSPYSPSNKSQQSNSKPQKNRVFNFSRIFPRIILKKHNRRSHKPPISHSH